MFFKQESDMLRFTCLEEPLWVKYRELIGMGTVTVEDNQGAVASHAGES